jgi:hypothetical protein
LVAATPHFVPDGPTTFVVAELPHPVTAEIAYRIARMARRMERREVTPRPHIFKPDRRQQKHHAHRWASLTDANGRTSRVFVGGHAARQAGSTLLYETYLAANESIER